MTFNFGSGDGYGDGSGDGYGDGSGYGSGYGYGYGDGDGKSRSLQVCDLDALLAAMILAQNGAIVKKIKNWKGIDTYGRSK